MGCVHDIHFRSSRAFPCHATANTSKMNDMILNGEPSTRRFRAMVLLLLLSLLFCPSTMGWNSSQNLLTGMDPNNKKYQKKIQSGREIFGEGISLLIYSNWRRQQSFWGWYNDNDRRKQSPNELSTRKRL